jgi:transglutaminase-like putative cysteine protease
MTPGGRRFRYSREGLAGPALRALTLILGLVLVPALPLPPLFADTIVLEGKLESTLHISKEMRWTVDRPLSRLTVELTMPANFSNRVLAQAVRNLQIDIVPKPAGIEDKRDNQGNVRKKITWYNLRTDPEVRLAFDARVEAGLAAMESGQAFPLKDLGPRERFYLKSTALVQSESREIKELCRELTQHATTEFQAVTAVFNYIADNIRYVYNPPKYDALSTLRDGSGNCTNAAHLSAAILRAAGIPARVVGGTTLDKQLKVPMDGIRSLVQTMGKGGHAWIEVYFPDLGWLSYDPKQSKQFTSTRHVKECHGLDSTDIAESWIGVPYAPAYSTVIDARFIEDNVKVHPVSMQEMPKSHVMSNELKVAFLAANNSEAPAPAVPVADKIPAPPSVQARPEEGPPVSQAPPVAPERPSVGRIPPVAPPQEPAVSQAPPPAPQGPGGRPGAPAPIEPSKPMEPPASVEPPAPAEPPAPQKRPEAKEPASLPREVVLGNIEFPALVATYTISGNKGSGLLDAETAEYVTSTYVYAQAFALDEPMAVRDVSLAMHKFGGDGTLYMDLVADDGGKPALRGARSLPVFLDTFEKKPGYSWLTFPFPKGSPETVLRKGKYWIVLRHSGEAVMTWFFIPGKSYSGPEDTRSTSKGYLWEDILAYDFVFRVKGIR